MTSDLSIHEIQYRCADVHKHICTHIPGMASDLSIHDDLFLRKNTKVDLVIRRGTVLHTYQEGSI